MDSEIHVRSEPDVGSSFWFELTVPVSSEAPSEPAEKPVSLDTASFNGTPKILLVDDNKINRDVAREILKKSGCEVTEASNGATSLELAKENTFDLIIMDIQMPDMDGIEAMKYMREQNKELPPIVAMTAYAMKEDEHRFLKKGFDGYIAKPIRAASMIKKLNKWLLSGDKAEKGDKDLAQDEEAHILNRSVLESLRKIGGNELVEVTYAEFFEEATELIEHINNSLTKSDYSSILAPLHTLKGNSGTLGADRLYNLSMKIETDLKDQKISNLEHDLRLLNTVFEEFKEKYKQISTDN
jgi:hypothetical protein